jgi:hypothetical protein
MRVEPRARFLHRVAILDAVDRDGFGQWTQFLLDCRLPA